VDRIPGETTLMSKHHKLTNVKVSDGVLSLVVDGSPLSRDLRILSPLLKNASNEDLAAFEISPSGYGIHWPRVDEDISIDGLLGIVHSPENAKQSA
jgi:hypothetical protein